MGKFSITQYGKPLNESRYNCRNKVLICTDANLVLDFTGIDNWIFIVKDSCTFKTGANCRFHTHSSCIFETGGNCIFNTGHHCTFETGNHCTFKTGDGCTFDTEGYCTFKTGWNCTFNTGVCCTFSLYDINTCKFKSYDGYSIILDRRDNEAYKLTKEFVALQKVKNR